MEILNKKDQELIDQLKKAGKPANFFVLKLEFNDKVLVEEKRFPAYNYSPESIEESSLHFILVDCVKKIQEELRKTESQKNQKTTNNSKSEE